MFEMNLSLPFAGMVVMIFSIIQVRNCDAAAFWLSSLFFSSRAARAAKGLENAQMAC